MSFSAERAASMSRLCERAMALPRAVPPAPGPRPRDEAIRVARSSLIDVVMRDLDENLREIVRASPIVGYQPAQRYDWVLKGVGG